MRMSAARRQGPAHRKAGTPCQDAFASFDDAIRNRSAAAVADGLGSQPLSHHGSQAACEAAVASLAAAQTWDDDALVAAFERARDALQLRADEMGVPLSAIATTLQVAVYENGSARCAMVGDGAIVVASETTTPAMPVDEAAAPLEAKGNVTPLLTAHIQAKVLVAPPEAQYANEVVPLTARDWRDHTRFAQAEGDAVFLFTDGLTRLLLTRKGRAWTPYGPFFDSFVPHLRGATFQSDLVEHFLQSPDVDRSWDDDKCMVVMAHEPK